MTLAVWIITIATFAVFVSRRKKVPVNNDTLTEGKYVGTEYVYKSFFLTFLLWVIYSLIFGCRAGFVDTSTYKLMAESIGSNFANLNNPEIAVVERGFNIWMILCNKFSNGNSQVFIFLTTAITLACAFNFIYRNSYDVTISIFFFIAFFSFTYINAIRQAIVAVIFAMLYDRFKDRRIIMIAAFLGLSFIHESALLLIPMYFCINGKFFNWRVKILFTVALFSIIGYSQIERLLAFFISEDYMETLSTMTKGTGILRMLINSIPFVLVLIQNRKKKLDGEEAGFGNIILIDMAINICSLKSTYFARMAIYFSIFIVAFYPRIINKVFGKSYRVLAYSLFVVFYVAFYIYQAYIYASYGYLNEFHLVPLW